MADRFKETERIMAATRKEIPAAAVKWLAAARTPLEKLTMAALSGEVTDEEFVKMVGEFSESLPGLLDKMDHAAIAEPLEAGMGAAMANGIARRIEDTPGKEVKAKLPWEEEAWLASRGKGKGKKCGNSMLVVTRQTGPQKDEVVTFTKKRPRELKKNRQGKRTFPGGDDSE